MYIKIIGEDTKYNVSYTPFTTQHGYKAIRFNGEIPSTDKGFKAYDDDDTEMYDLSDYTHEYRPNEYSVEEDTIEMPTGNYDPLPVNPIDRQFANLSQRISDITPYKQSKIGYFGDKEKDFYDVPDGNISVFFDNYDGNYSIDRIGNRLIVSFDKLTDTTTITVMVQ